MGVPWTATELAILENGYARNLGSAEIAAMLPGRSRAACINKAAQRGPRPPRKPAPPPPEPWESVRFTDDPRARVDHGSGQRPVIDRTDVLRSSAAWFA